MSEKPFGKYKILQGIITQEAELNSYTFSFDIPEIDLSYKRSYDNKQTQKILPNNRILSEIRALKDQLDKF
ncbi:MAG: hypothetical protein PHS44_04585 [Candidatus Dojkabacteria bacterium]|jgi:hypothetical protein|nr:hypothetical protein [Candidatus Dojkabacteria bacterium]